MEKLLILGMIIVYLYAGSVDYKLLYNKENKKESVVYHAEKSPIPVAQNVSRGGTPKIIHAKVTAYAPLDNKSGICADETPTSTSTGKYPVKGIVAVDPKKIRYGTKMYIPGYGEAIAEDTGGALRSYKGVQIDVVMPTYKEAKKWGVRYLDVTILE